MSGYENMKAQGSAAEVLKRQHHSFAEQVAWCETNVSGEHPGLAASAAQLVKLSGRRVTPDAIRARLRATGRDARSLGERTQTKGSAA